DGGARAGHHQGAARRRELPRRDHGCTPPLGRAREQPRALERARPRRALRRARGARPVGRRRPRVLPRAALMAAPDGTDAGTDDRYARGEAVYDEVYGSQRPPRGASLYVDTMVEQLFAEVWSREALPVRDRRLLVMGVLAAQGALDKAEMQLRRAVEVGELTVDQVDEVILHLSHYIGWGLASPLAMVGAALRDEVTNGHSAGAKADDAEGKAR